MVKAEGRAACFQVLVAGLVLVSSALTGCAAVKPLVSGGRTACDVGVGPQKEGPWSLPPCDSPWSRAGVVGSLQDGRVCVPGNSRVRSDSPAETEFLQRYRDLIFLRVTGYSNPDLALDPKARAAMAHMGKRALPFVFKYMDDMPLLERVAHDITRLNICDLMEGCPEGMWSAQEYNVLWRKWWQMHCSDPEWQP